jgi:hypothetical protein
VAQPPRVPRINLNQNESHHQVSQAKQPFGEQRSSQDEFLLDNGLQTPKLPHEGGFAWTAAHTIAGASGGFPKNNQDRWLGIEEFIRNQDDEWLSLHMVADGHGPDGHLVS